MNELTPAQRAKAVVADTFGTVMDLIDSDMPEMSYFVTDKVMGYSVRVDISKLDNPADFL